MTFEVKSFAILSIFIKLYLHLKCNFFTAVVYIANQLVPAFSVDGTLAANGLNKLISY